MEQTALVLGLIRQLRERGLSIVLISHNLTDVFQVADHIVVLRLGRRVATFQRRAATMEDVVAAITGGTSGTSDTTVSEGVAS